MKNSVHIFRDPWLTCSVYENYQNCVKLCSAGKTIVLVVRSERSGERGPGVSTKSKMECSLHISRVPWLTSNVYCV